MMLVRQQGHRKTLRATLLHLYEYRTFLKYQTLGKLKARHRGTYLGYLWWLLDPLLFLAIYYVLFSVIFKRGQKDYILFLFSALLPWRWFSTSLSEATSSVRNSGVLIKRVYFPKVILPLSSIFNHTFNFLFGLTVLGLLMIAYRVPVGVHFLFFPLIALTQITFTAALGVLLADIDVFFKDMGQLLGYILQMWFYLSPGLYPLQMVPPRMRSIFYLNPFTTFFTGYRDVCMYGRWPDIPSLLLWSAGSALVLLFGIRRMANREGHYAKVL